MKSFLVALLSIVAVSGTRLVQQESRRLEDMYKGEPMREIKIMAMADEGGKGWYTGPAEK